MRARAALGILVMVMLLKATASTTAGATATVMGMVKDGSNGNAPLVGAWVVVDTPGNSVATNAQGFYVLENITLNPMPHYFAIVKSGYAVYQLLDAPILDGQSNTLNAEMYQGCLISGTVTDAVSGAMLAGVTITANNLAGTSYYSTVSLASGVYYQRQPPGACYLWADRDGYAPSPYSIFPFLKDRTTETLDLRLYQGGTVSGRVTYEDTGLPAAYVPVSATASWTNNDRPRSVTFTAADGTYTLSHVYPGDTDITIQAPPGYSDGKRSVLVKDRLLLPGIDFQLRYGGALQGVISDYLGGGVDNAEIVLAPASGNLLNQRSTRTSSSGAYSLTGLAPGDYFLQVKPSQGTNLQLAQSGGVTIVQGTPVVRNFTLQPGGTVQGTVRYQGTPVPDTRIQVYLDLQYPFTERVTQTTDASGHFVVDGFSPYQSYTLSVVPPGNTVTPMASRLHKGVTVAELQVLTLEFDLPPGGGRTGSVAPPAPGQAVVFNADLGMGVGINDLSGDYEVTSVPEGDYAFIVVPSAGSSAPLTDYFHVTPGAVETYDVVLEPGGAIEGTVVEAASGSPVAEVRVVARNRDELLSSLPEFEHKTFTDETGYYKLNGLAEGDYRLEFLPPVQDAGGLAAQQAGVAVAAGETSVQDITLQPGGVKIHGTVRDPFGNRIIGGFACFTSAALHVEAETDAWGNYLVMLPPGAYQAQALYTSLLGVNLAMEPEPFTVSASVTPLQRDFVMQTGGRVSGRVTDQLGVPVPRSVVTVYQNDSHQPVRAAITGQDGAYQIGGLHSGVFSVQAAAAGFSRGLKQAGVSLGSQTGNVGMVLVEAVSIAGTVRDRNGRVLPGAVVQALDPSTQDVAAQTATNPAGEYVLEPLSGGPWSVKASATGLQSRILTGLMAGDRADFMLEPLIGKSEAVSYPNPCRSGRVTFLYWLEQDATVLIRVYNLGGELVWDWEGPGAGGGYRKNEWDVTGVAPGVYLYKIAARKDNGDTVSFPPGKLTVIQ